MTIDSPAPITPQASGPAPNLALVLSGGGALAAYQVGFLSGICQQIPQFTAPILTGVSAGAINAVGLAALPGSFAQRVETLRSAWSSMQVEDVFRVDSRDLSLRALRWGMRLVSGGKPSPKPRSLLDNTPLRGTLSRLYDLRHDGLHGIDQHLRSGSLRAVAVTGSRIRTEESVTWVQGAELYGWARAHRVGIHCALNLDHVMASAALPWLFPAVQIEGEWYCDGGIRLTAPLSPAVHLGADHILAISIRPSSAEQGRPLRADYPPPADLAGMLLSSVFLDQLDGDALRAQRINDLLVKLPPHQRNGMRPVRVLLVRPSCNLDELANRYEPQLPTAFRFLLRGLGTKESSRNDFLSLLMFQSDYLQHLCEIGAADARAREAELRQFFGLAETSSAIGEDR